MQLREEEQSKSVDIQTLHEPFVKKKHFGNNVDGCQDQWAANLIDIFTKCVSQRKTEHAAQHKADQWMSEIQSLRVVLVSMQREFREHVQEIRKRQLLQWQLCSVLPGLF